MEEMKIEIEGDQALIDALVKIVVQLNETNHYSFEWLMQPTESPGIKILIIKGSDPMHFYSLGLKHAIQIALSTARAKPGVRSNIITKSPSYLL